MKLEMEVRNVLQRYVQYNWCNCVLESYETERRVTHWRETHTERRVTQSDSERREAQREERLRETQREERLRERDDVKRREICMG